MKNTRCAPIRSIRWRVARAALVAVGVTLLLPASGLAASDTPASVQPAAPASNPITTGTIADLGKGAVGAQSPPHVLKPRIPGVAAPAAPSNPLVYRGGAIQTSPTVVVGFWGTAFRDGFNKNGVTNDQYKNYILSGLGPFGGIAYMGSQTQYCQGVSIGTVNCNGSGTPVGNPPAQLVGSWTILDNNPPAVPTQSDIAAAADWVRRAQYGTFGNDANANIMIFTLPDHNTADFPSKACAWHSAYFSGSSFSNVHYTNMPFIPQAPLCGGNFVNPNDGFGHGALDGVSISMFHEQAEVITSPNLDGWNDNSTPSNETGDKCAWQGLTNIRIGGVFEAVQPLWSNRDNACVVNQFPAYTASPASRDFGAVPVNTTAGFVDITVTNIGGADSVPTGASLSGDTSHFTIGNNTCQIGAVHPGFACIVRVSALPTSGGLHQATLFIPDGVDGLGARVALSVTGLDPGISVGPPLDFGRVATGDTSSGKLVTVANTGSAPLSVTSTAVDLGFSLSSGGNCPAAPFALAPGAACTQGIVFSPTSVASYSGTFRVTSNAPGINSATTAGVGVDPLQVSPQSINFGSVGIDQVSGPKVQTLTNVGSRPITISGMVGAGPATGDYSETDNCLGTALPSGGSCQITTTFSPFVSGVRNASWQVLSNASTGTHTLSLTGVGRPHMCGKFIC